MEAPAAPEVHVWRADLATVALPECGPAGDRDRAAGAVSEQARRRALASRWALRLVLARYGAGDPGGLTLIPGAHGKPALAGGPHFNVTHTADLWLAAVSADRAVGIDAERVRDRGDVLALARHGLTDADRTQLQAASEADRVALFHRLWVRREATVKCHGTGLGAAAEVAGEPVTIADATVDAVPVALAAAGAGPIDLRWLVLAS